MIINNMRPHDEDELEVGAIEVEAAAHIVPRIHAARFDTRQAAAASGVEVGKLQNWLTRGVVQLEGEQNPGRGQSRQYTAYEIARLGLMRMLSEGGIPLDTAFALTMGAKKSWQEVMGGHELYGAETDLSSWLLVFRASSLPSGLKASIIRAADYAAMWIVDQANAPDAPRGLRQRLLSINGPCLVINLGAFLRRTISDLLPMAGEDR